MMQDIENMLRAYYWGLKASLSCTQQEIQEMESCSDVAPTEIFDLRAHAHNLKVDVESLRRRYPHLEAEPVRRAAS